MDWKWWFAIVLLVSPVMMPPPGISGTYCSNEIDLEERAFVAKGMVMRWTSRFSISAIAVWFLVPVFTRGEDWPTWRHDAQRSGVSAEGLADELHLKWQRALSPVQVAWPNESRLHFDASIEPVVMGKRMFVGLVADGSVRAYDTESGEEVWRFYSEGPVRLAPVAWRDGVYFGSDDGRLYCLDSGTGTPRWKVRGAPDDRPDYRHLGNARLISYWPVRGGPVIEDGVVFFGAGIWPSMGVYFKAVDAETGEVKWSNGKTNYLENVRIDHNQLHEAALSPQGYCLYVDGKLVAPNGRSMPARFDPETGELLYFVQGYRRGDSRVTSTGRFLMVGAQAVVDVKDGREVGDRSVSAGEDAPVGFKSDKRDLFEGPIFGYKFMKGCDYRSAFEGGVSYGVDQGFLFGWDLHRAEVSLYEKDDRGTTVHPARWDAPRVWDRMLLEKGEEGSTRTTILAGDRLYTHVDRTLFAVQMPGKGAAGGVPSLAWRRVSRRNADEHAGCGRKTLCCARRRTDSMFRSGSGSGSGRRGEALRAGTRAGDAGCERPVGSGCGRHFRRRWELRGRGSPSCLGWNLAGWWRNCLCNRN